MRGTERERTTTFRVWGETRPLLHRSLFHSPSPSPSLIQRGPPHSASVRGSVDARMASWRVRAVRRRYAACPDRAFDSGIGAHRTPSRAQARHSVSPPPLRCARCVIRPTPRGPRTLTSHVPRSLSSHSQPPAPRLRAVHDRSSSHSSSCAPSHAHLVSLIPSHPRIAHSSLRLSIDRLGGRRASAH